MKRIPVFLSLWLLIAGCTPHYNYEYIIAGLNMHNEDNSGSVPVDATSNDIPAKAYALRLEFTNDLTNPGQNHNDESYYKLLNPVKSFSVTSLSDFDNTHPAGSLLNNYFLYGADTYEVSAKDSIRYHISRATMGGGIFKFSRHHPQNWITNDYLVLMQPPAYYGQRSFIIHMELKDSTSITDTISVNLLP